MEKPHDVVPWFDRPRYYTQVTGESADPVTVFGIPEDIEVSSEQPGTPVLRLEPGSRLVRVRDAVGMERGIIGPKEFCRVSSTSCAAMAKRCGSFERALWSSSVTH